MKKRLPVVSISSSHGLGDRRVVARAGSVIYPKLFEINRKLARTLSGRRFLRSGGMVYVGFCLSCAYVKGYLSQRYESRSVRHTRGRCLEVTINANGIAISQLTPEQFGDEMLWTCLDVLIDIAGRKSLDASELVRARARLMKPPRSAALDGALSGRVPEPEPIDPFKYEIELHVPLAGGKFGDEKELKALQKLDDSLHRALECRDIGCWEGREVGDGEAVFFLRGLDINRMIKAIRDDFKSRNDGFRVPVGNYALCRRAFSDAKGRRVRF